LDNVRAILYLNVFRDIKYDVIMNGKPESKLWTSTGIKLLIENQSTFEEDFNNNKKNYKIWEKKADKLCKNGIIVSGSNCNVKFKNLMATFSDK